MIAMFKTERIVYILALWRLGSRWEQQFCWLWFDSASIRTFSHFPCRVHSRFHCFFSHPVFFRLLEDARVWVSDLKNREAHRRTFVAPVKNLGVKLEHGTTLAPPLQK